MTIAPSRVSHLMVLLALGVGTWGGCGGGSGGKKTYPDAAFPGTGGTLGGGGTGLPASGGTLGGGGSGSGGATVSDAGVPMPDAPPAATNTLVLPGIAVLVGPGFSCSHSMVATGAAAPERWCGAITVASSTATTASLLVFNESKAVAGTPITCAAADPNCLTLSTDVALTSDAQHGFYGQTLVYYDDAGVYAWRPGWPAGRKLIDRSATLGAHCDASAADATTAICFQQDISTTADSPVAGFAGSIDTPTGAALPAFESNLGSRPRFTPDGLSVIWSTGNNATTGAGTLKLKKIGDASAAATVATGVALWGLSGDGKSWLWQAAPAVDTRTKAVLGTLQSAPFPAGTPAVALQTKTYDYVTFGAKGVTVLSTPGSTGYDLKSFPDVTAAAPTGTVVEPADAIYISDVDASGRVLFSTDGVTLDDTGDNFAVDLQTAKADGTGKCTVTPDLIAYPGSMTAAGTGVVWAEVTIDTSGSVIDVTGRVTTLADCMTRSFGDAISGFADVTTGLVYGENFNADATTADLSYASFAAAGTLNPKMQIQKEADVSFETLFPEQPRVLFSLNGRATGNGIYLSPALTGVPTTMSVIPVPTVRAASSSARARAQAATLASRLGLPAVKTSPRALALVNAQRAFGARQLPSRFLRSRLTKVSRQ